MQRPAALSLIAARQNRFASVRSRASGVASFPEMWLTFGFRACRYRSRCQFTNPRNTSICSSKYTNHASENSISEFTKRYSAGLSARNVRSAKSRKRGFTSWYLSPCVSAAKNGLMNRNGTNRPRWSRCRPAGQERAIPVQAAVTSATDAHDVSDVNRTLQLRSIACRIQKHPGNEPSHRDI